MGAVKNVDLGVHNLHRQLNNSSIEPPEDASQKWPTAPDEWDVERVRRRVEELIHMLHALGHDLREPIRTVGCYSALLGKNAAIQSDPNLSEFVHLIAGAACRMGALVESVLDYSQLIGGEPQPHGPVDMNAVVQTALANLQLKIDESGATIIHDALPRVIGDYVQLVELVQNLVANSIKYRSAEPPRIAIRSEQRDSEELFSIEDNGIGIDAKDCESIFKAFKRLHGQELPGSGLGLAICRQIVEIHGGLIWAERARKNGTIFRFTLPAPDLPESR